MHPKQFESIIALSGEERYEHFIARVSDWEEVWSLKNQQGFVSFGDSEENKGIPFWPHPDYASALATGEWSDCQPQRIELETLLSRWLPGMKKDGVLAAIFPTPRGKGIMVDPEELGSDIWKECEQYE